MTPASAVSVRPLSHFFRFSTYSLLTLALIAALAINVATLMVGSVFNLISNALKFTLEGGHVTVVADTAGDSVRLEVHDTGVGIPSEDMDSIFERFRRAGNAAEANEEGLGLGLVSTSFVKTLGKTLTLAHRVAALLPEE